MHLDLRHLRSVREIHRQGGLVRAAEVLGLTQSALSHQIKAMEAQAGVELFHRRAKPMRLTAAGQRLLRLAEQVLPEVEAVEQDFRSLRLGRTGRLHIALECHACYDWLLPLLTSFRKLWPDVDIDIRAGLAFTALPALARGDVDVVLSSDPEEIGGVTFHPLFEYQPTLITAHDGPLAAREVIAPQDLADQVLLTYPVDRARLDSFNVFLGPAGVEPKALRQVELTDIMLMLVASGRGVAILPDWVLHNMRDISDLAFRPLLGRPVKRMYAAIRDEDVAVAFMAHFLRLARSEPQRLHRRRD